MSPQLRTPLCDLLGINYLALTIVTGGAQGIGLAIAAAVLAHGGSVLVADVDGEAVAPPAAPETGAGAVDVDVDQLIESWCPAPVPDRI